MANNFETTHASSGTPTPTEVDILGAALGPLRVRTEEGTVEERPMSDLIAASRALNPPPNAVPWGIRMARVQPGSTTPGVKPLTRFQFPQ